MFQIEYIDFRDPLIGIITVFIFIFIVSFITYSIGLYKERKLRLEYRKLLNRFELGTLKEDDYIHLYSTYNLPFDSIILLASSFLYKGQYNKAISVYLVLLEHVEEKVKKEELLELLGMAYFKSGLLQRSKEIYLKILKFSPRNKVALKNILLVFQSLKEFSRALEVLDALEELDENTIKERIYINLLTIVNDPLLSFDTKSIQLYNNFTINKTLERVVVEYLLKFNKTLLWNNIEKFNISKSIDLFWYLDFDDIEFDKVTSNKLLEELYTAKGYILLAKQSDVFELNILIALKHSKSDVKVDLNFDFTCSKCKHTHPMYESRCPHCQSILTFGVKPKIAQDIHGMKSFV